MCQSWTHFLYELNENEKLDSRIGYFPVNVPAFWVVPVHKGHNIWPELGRHLIPVTQPVFHNWWAHSLQGQTAFKYNLTNTTGKQSILPIHQCIFNRWNTRTTRTPAFWFWWYPSPPHDYPILFSHIGSQVKRRQSQSYKFKEFASISISLILRQTLHATHLLKLLDKMCKYEMDLTSIVEDTEQTLFCPQTDRQMKGQGETSIPPFQFHWSGGYYNLTLNRQNFIDRKNKGVSQNGQTRNIIGMCLYCVLDRPVLEQNQTLHHPELTSWWSSLPMVSTTRNLTAPYVVKVNIILNSHTQQ